MVIEKRSTSLHFMRHQGWAYALLVAAGLGLGAYQISSYQTASRFALEGVESLGQVTHKLGYTSSNRQTYILSYVFPTPDDPYNHGEQLVSKPFYDSQAEDAEIVVRYLPSDPSASVVEPANLTQGFWLGLLASTGLIMGGMAGLVVGLSRARANAMSSDKG